MMRRVPDFFGVSRSPIFKAISPGDASDKRTHTHTSSSGTTGKQRRETVLASGEPPPRTESLQRTSVLQAAVDPS